MSLSLDRAGTSDQAEGKALRPMHGSPVWHYLILRRSNAFAPQSVVKITPTETACREASTDRSRDLIRMK
jgi:hypothetical protein